MAVRITYFVHASTTDNDLGIATGWLQGELSAKGREQAIELGRLLRGRHFDAVFCSDLSRAVESAALVFGPSVEPRPDARLRECNYGDFNGTPANAFKDQLSDFVSTPFPNGESYTDVERRMSEFLAFLRSEWNGRRVAVVAHQAPQLALNVLIGGRTWKQAIDEDWRGVGAWQPGWEYTLA